MVLSVLCLLMSFMAIEPLSCSLHVLKDGVLGSWQVIELPIKHPELFESLGIAQPKVHFLPPQQTLILRSG